MEFRLLGPVEADVDGRPVALGGPKERCLLALLLLHANEVLSRDTLIDQLWATPPGDAKHALEARISALRKRLGTQVIATKPGGYELAVDPERLDLERFRRRVADGRAALAAGDAGAAEDVLTAALALWRGPPLADLRYEEIAPGDLARLEEERLAALELRAQARLTLGRHEELVVELEALVDDCPLRERLYGLLMVALYRSGRQAEALDVFARARRFLVDELGIEPDRELWELQESILRHDPRLEPPRRPEAAAAPARRPADDVAGVPQRKVVTVLFCDLTDSTALAERLDPEALRGVLDRYFEHMKRTIERYGGTVEKFIGDAVMAVFGLPLLHEDDALRACRAACEMRDALPELAVEARIGLATGEVLTGSDTAFATGTAVNLAARLEQAAAAGEVLVDAATVAVVQAAAALEPLGPLELKGLSKPVPAYRLLTAAAASPPPAVRAPFIGRVTELRRLHDAFSQAVADRSCQLFTLLGPAGIGKSRLAQEFLSQVDARVVRGGCVSYGDGITYAPVVEVVQQLEARPDDPGASAALGSLLRESHRPTSPEEIAWAFRKTLEAAAAGEPVVCLFEDLHWAEPPLLDLIEHVADLSRGAPIFLLCLARPELHEERPGWAGGKLNATTLLLAPLTAEESHRLVDALAPDVGPLRLRIVAGADGNPLFLEEMLALARDCDDGEIGVPPTIHALLSARLDRLDTTERTLLERAAVEGKEFDRPALEALSPDVHDLRSRLESLVRRDLIRPVPGDDEAYLFRHQLIRDTAYGALPKELRADVHRRLGSWLSDHASTLVEPDAVIGYHLAEACLYERELGRSPDAARAAEARRRLTVAGRRAFRDRDHAAAAKLLRRAVELLDQGAPDAGLELDLLMSLFYAGDVQGALERVEREVELAAAAHNRNLELTLRVWRCVADVFLARGTSGLAASVSAAMPVFRASGDEVGLFAGEIGAWFLANGDGRPDDAVAAAERALEHAQRAGLPHYDSILVPSAGLSRWYGSCPCSELVRWADAQEWGVGERFRRLLTGLALGSLGRLDEALALVAGILEESAGRVGVFYRALILSFVAELCLLAGDAAGAADLAERASLLAEEMGERTNYASYLLQLADAQSKLGRFDEADARLRRATEVWAADANQAELKIIRARILTARGEWVAAAGEARDAASSADLTQFLALQGDAHAAAGEALALAGDTEGARQELEEALDRYGRKEHLVGAARVRDLLARLETFSCASGS